MVRELKIGILAIVVTFLVIWGFQFVKGKNILGNIKTFHAIYDRVDQLNVAAPVTVNGYQIGSVSKIQLNPKNVKTIIVSMEVDGNIPFPNNMRAVLSQAGLVEGKMIALEFEELCGTLNCAENNDTLTSKVRGFVESLVGEDNLDNYMKSIKSGASEVYDTISSRLQDKGSDSPVNEIVWDLQRSLSNFAEITKTFNLLLLNSYKDLDSTFANMNTISKSIADNNGKINEMLENMNVITAQLKEANPGQMLANTNSAIDTVTAVFTDMKQTLDEANTAFSHLNEILEKMDSGDGTLAKLINDKALYENLDTTVMNISLLLQDLRLNPGRYLRFSVFGKKDKEYALPEDDPAFKKNGKN